MYQLWRRSVLLVQIKVPWLFANYRQQKSVESSVVKAQSIAPSKSSLFNEQIKMWVSRMKTFLPESISKRLAYLYLSFNIPLLMLLECLLYSFQWFCLSQLLSYNWLSPFYLLQIEPVTWQTPDTIPSWCLTLNQKLILLFPLTINWIVHKWITFSVGHFLYLHSTALWAN